MNGKVQTIVDAENPTVTTRYLFPAQTILGPFDKAAFYYTISGTITGTWSIEVEYQIGIGGSVYELIADVGSLTAAGSGIIPLQAPYADADLPINPTSVRFFEDDAGGIAVASVFMVTTA